MTTLNALLRAATVLAAAAISSLALAGCDRSPATPPTPSTAHAGAPAMSAQSDS